VSFDRTFLHRRGLIVVGGGCQAQSGERQHVDQPAGAAGDVVGAQERVEAVTGGWAGAGEELRLGSADDPTAPGGVETRGHRIHPIERPPPVVSNLADKAHVRR
jgi:hypothetical protein